MRSWMRKERAKRAFQATAQRRTLKNQYVNKAFPGLLSTGLFKQPTDTINQYLSLTLLPLSCPESRLVILLEDPLELDFRAPRPETLAPALMP